MQIKSSVGSGGVNDLMDVSVVQYLLNRASARVGTPLELIEVDGIMGPMMGYLGVPSRCDLGEGQCR